MKIVEPDRLYRKNPRVVSDSCVANKSCKLDSSLLLFWNISRIIILNSCLHCNTLKKLSGLDMKSNFK